MLARFVPNIRLVKNELLLNYYFVAQFNYSLLGWMILSRFNSDRVLNIYMKHDKQLTNIKTDIQ